MSTHIINQLQTVLPLHLYGKGDAKDFDSLVKEIKGKESLILFQADESPLRCLNVARVKVIHVPKNLILVEDYQQFVDGRVRRRRQPNGGYLQQLSEKMYVGEKPTDAARRCLKEELKLSKAASDATKIVFDGNGYKAVISPSYPGLMTQCTFHDFTAFFPLEEEYWQEEFKEMCGDDIEFTIFKWVVMD